MNEQSVVELMGSSRTEAEWNANADKVKAHFNGYPNWWYGAIVMSGVLRRTAARWGSDGEIKIEQVDPSFFN